MADNQTFGRGKKISGRTKKTGIQSEKVLVSKGKTVLTDSDLEPGLTDKINKKTGEVLPAKSDNLLGMSNARKAGSNGRVLVMDDDDVIRDMARIALKKLGYKVEAACNSEEAIELYKKSMDAGNPFDVVILDFTIPGGIGAKQTIKKLLKIEEFFNIEFITENYFNQ